MATRTAPLIPTGTWEVDPAHSSVEFSAVGQSPKMTFESTRVEAIDDESSRVYGSGNVLVGDKVKPALDLSAVLQS